MKSRYTTIDLRAAITELGVRLMGLRVINIYDINNKTYLIKLQGADKKEMLLIESGIRINSTDFDWPKSNMPSNFSMKLRKHLKSRRLNQLHQLGMDRVVDMQFGSDEAAYHLIVELYDRGNIILTDSEYTILNLLRTRTDSEDVRFAVRETYPVEAAKKSEALPEPNRLQEILATAKPGDPIRKILNPHFVFGPAVIEHCLLRQGFPSGVRLDKEFSPETDIPRLLLALREAQELMEQSGHPQNKGYVIQKTEKKPTAGEGSEETELLTYTEYHPFLYEQHGSSPYIELDSFNQAVDEFYSKLESQKTDMKVLQQEKDALRKLENVKKDHEKRLEQLSKTQEIDKRKGELIEMNLPLVDQAIKVVRSAIANQIDWTEINNIIHEAQAQQDPVASAIRSLKLDTNHITMMLRDPYEDQQEEDESLEEPAKKQKKKKKDKANYIDIDLGLSAYANARRDPYEDQQEEDESLEEPAKKQKKKKKDKANYIDIDLGLSAYANARRDPYEDQQEEDESLEEPAKKQKKKKKDKANYIDIDLGLSAYANARRDPYEDQQEEDESLEEPAKKQKKKKKDKANYIDIDLGLSAYANARRFYEQKKFAKKKEQRTVDASEKAIKSAEKKTKQALKDVATVASINKTRKTYWFEKFYWFISSENYLVIAGRDQQQNEMVVKKYLSQDDIYVHADLHGASSVIVKNPTGGPVPPVTLQEAGVMAICYSVAWDAKVVTSAWWVHHDQVSKTAPTGEYLTTGSFMIRGKKNYLPPAQLMMGFGFMFKVDDSCVWRHKDERRVRGVEEDDMSLADSSTVDGSFDEEIQLADDSDDSIDNDSRNGKEDSQAGMAIVDMEDDDSDDEDEQRDKRGKVVETHLSSDDDMAYPDTAIQLHHVQGAKLEPERSRGSSVLSAGSHHSSEGDAEMKIYLGDDQPVLISVDRQGSKQTGKQYLSAKQKRQLKKQKRKTSGNLDDGDAEAEGKQEPGMEEVPSEDDPRMPGLDIDEETETREDTEEQEVDKKKEVAAGQPPQHLKRGQKNKQKKIKQKYKDQDEEERRLKMEILASAGSPKELRGKKAKQARKQQLLEEKHQQMKQKQRQRNQAGKQQGGRHTGETDRQLQEKMQRVTMTDEQDDDSVQPVVFKHAWKPKKGPAHDEDTGGLSDEDQEASLKDEHSQLMKESSSILDSLTGCPHTEDGLLFGLPVCAPYSVMHNYKFKVKLTPGSGKRGKAAKTALNMFQFSKETTSREKDLFKSVKDTDLSRNLPGKVKVSAPNLQKTKSKTKKK